MTENASPKALKESNRWQLWLTIAANYLVFCAVVQVNTFAISGSASPVSGATNLLPMGLALIITSIANGLLTAAMKARLVFLRWKFALPGHRAFSKYALSDPRIDVERLKRALSNKIPADPKQQNQVWYRLFKEVENDPAVRDVHKEFLFTRDYTGFAALFFVFLGPTAALLLRPGRESLIYCSLLLLQYLIVRQAAATYGARFVCTVLARKAALAPSSSSKAR